MLMLFAALPLAVAVSAGRNQFWHAGAVALKVLLRGLLVLIARRADGGLEETSGISIDDIAGIRRI